MQYHFDMAEHASGNKLNQHDITSVFYVYMSGALALTVGLAWNSAFQNFFKHITWLSKWGPFAYAALVTILAFVVLMVAKRTMREIERVAKK
tara:strand:+ start:751 stop:1026 length:276 start_codon:yes stop_codon:yes gene_type:complete